MKIIHVSFIALFLLNSKAMAESIVDNYDQAYEKCEEFASTKIENDYDDVAWQQEFEKCMKKEGIDTKDLYESGMAE